MITLFSNDGHYHYLRALWYFLESLEIWKVPKNYTYLYDAEQEICETFIFHVAVVPAIVKAKVLAVVVPPLSK